MELAVRPRQALFLTKIYSTLDDFDPNLHRKNSMANLLLLYQWRSPIRERQRLALGIHMVN
jgi:hypothetical protein